MVDASFDHELFTFMNILLEYNQIIMISRDRKNISFIIDQGIYCLQVVSFGLNKYENNIPKDDKQNI